MDVSRQPYSVVGAWLPRYTALYLWVMTGLRPTGPSCGHGPDPTDSGVANIVTELFIVNSYCIIRLTFKIYTV